MINFWNRINVTTAQVARLPPLKSTGQRDHRNRIRVP